MLMQCFQCQQQDISNLLQSSASTMHSPSNSSHTSPSLSDSRSNIKTTDHYNNARYEDIICRPIKPMYDGSPDHLVPFLNRLDIRRQDEAWKAVTYITENNQTFDLIRHPRVFYHSNCQR
jgi:hypothetical protein